MKNLEVKIDKLILIICAFAILYFQYLSYRYIVSPRFEYANMIFDDQIHQSNFFLLIIYSIIPILFIKTKIKVAYILFLVVYVFVYFPILIVSPHFLSLNLSSGVYFQLFCGMSLIAWMADREIRIAWRGHRVFHAVTLLLASLFLMQIVLFALRSGLRFPSFTEIYFFRGELSMGTLMRYSVSLYCFAIGPLLAAIAFYHRNVKWIILTLGTFVVIYGFTFQKFYALAPLLLIAFMAVFWKWQRPKTQVLLLLYASPLLLSLIYVGFAEIGIVSGAYTNQVVGVFLSRLYAVTGQVFAHYYDFFSYSEHTYFSHVSGISRFVEYPYQLPIPLEIREAYPGGNQNANFWAQDAIAGAGAGAIIPISFLFGLALIAVNSVSRGLDVAFCVIAFSICAQRFSDGTLATGLFSGGMALLIILIALAPRNIFGERM